MFPYPEHTASLATLLISVLHNYFAANISQIVNITSPELLYTAFLNVYHFSLPPLKVLFVCFVLF